jgi:hypothetical protein
MDQRPANTAQWWGFHSRFSTSFPCFRFGSARLPFSFIDFLMGNMGIIWLSGDEPLHIYNV